MGEEMLNDEFVEELSEDELNVFLDTIEDCFEEEEKKGKSYEGN